MLIPIRLPNLQKLTSHTPDDFGLKREVCRHIYPLRDYIQVMLPEEASLASK